MTLQSDTEALASIEEEARAMLKKIGLPDDPVKKEVVISLRQIIAIARYRKGLGADPVVEYGKALAGSAGSGGDRELLGQGLLHCRDDAAEVVPVRVALHGVGWQVPPVVTEYAVHELAVGAAALVERTGVANVLGLIQQAPGILCVKIPVTPHLHDHLPRFVGQGLGAEAARAQGPVEVADDVGVVQLAEELADGQAIPHAAPVSVPGLVVAADGDLAFAGR
ncbi:hypothetical protein ACF8R6_02955 [Pseudomonas sp. CJQ_7]|uniref:hypothetical protein n=1 Tax=Pseudomonas sp. CJQ_7 TaxID=3367166 RepID=UPI003709EAB4